METINNNIKISKDKLFRLVQEMKEYRNLLSKTDTINLMRRHRTKIEYLILDKILTNDGIDILINKVKDEKYKIRMIELIKLEEGKDDN